MDHPTEPAGTWNPTAMGLFSPGRDWVFSVFSHQFRRLGASIVTTDLPGYRWLLECWVSAAPAAINNVELHRQGLVVMRLDGALLDGQVHGGFGGTRIRFAVDAAGGEYRGAVLTDLMGPMQLVLSLNDEAPEVLRLRWDCYLRMSQARLDGNRS